MREAGLVQIFLVRQHLFIFIILLLNILLHNVPP